MYSNQLYLSSTLASTTSKNAVCISSVIGPLLPIPISLPSTDLIGVTSAADPVKNSSSAMYSDSLCIGLSMTSYPKSFAICIIVARVIPSNT